jgi:hypothetical protein
MFLKRVLATVKTPSHLAKQYMHRRIDSSYQADFVNDGEKAHLQTLADDLKKNGIIMLPAFFQGEKLNKLRDAFERVTAGKTNKYSPDSLWTDDILVNEPIMVEAALDSALLQIIGLYFHRRFAVSVASAHRLDPTPPHRDGSYQWHHDARGKQINLMILLSHVTSKGQRMTYLRGSHGRYYDYYNGIVDTHTRFNNEVDSNKNLHDNLVEVIGPPGTIALFDSNGLHSGNRNDVERRDCLIINYASWRHFKKVRINKSDFLGLPQYKQHVLTFNPKLELVD